MSRIFFSSLDKLERVEKEYGIMGTIFVIGLMVIVTVLTIVGVVCLLKLWLMAMESLVPMLLDGWKLK